MLHMIHLLERRHGNHRAHRIAMRLLLASMLLLMLGLGLLLPGRAAAQDATPVDGAAIATRLLDHLDAGRYADAEAMFSPEMAAAVPADKLKGVWESLPAQAGPAQGRGIATSLVRDGTTWVEQTLQYSKATLVAKLAIDAQGRIAGFLIQPAQAPVAPAAAVAEDAAFVERDFSVGEGERALPGTLAMPKGDGPFAAVVLVHGSGAHDRDETVGPTKPFLDIARGLAAHGIAVLRFDKPDDLARAQGRPARPQPGRDAGAADCRGVRARRRAGADGGAGTLAAGHRDRAEPPACGA